tara:strand:+ start:252 stop:545 length:294 start_codon:yes stop_codon:yes gene_type:complete
MTDLLSTRTQRNWGTDHVYLENISVSIFWENVTGKKTVSDDDLANLRFFIQTVTEIGTTKLLNAIRHINDDDENDPDFRGDLQTAENLIREVINSNE